MELLLYGLIGLWAVLYVGAAIAVFRQAGWEAKLVGLLLLVIGAGPMLGVIWLLNVSLPITG